MGKYLEKFKAEQEAKKKEEEQERASKLPISDKAYWDKYTPKKENLEEDEYGDVDEMYSSLHNHDIEMDIAITFKNMNGVIYQTKEKSINCNILDLDNFFARLKKLIRLLDETKGDGIGDGSGGL
jgi:hypothetical protein